MYTKKPSEQCYLSANKGGPRSDPALKQNICYLPPLVGDNFIGKGCAYTQKLFISQRSFKELHLFIVYTVESQLFKPPSKTPG